MESTQYAETNLFEQSDNEGDANVFEENRAKRKRDLSDKDARDNKKVNTRNAEISDTKGSVRVTGVTKKTKPIEINPLWSIEDTLFFPLGIQSHHITETNSSVLLIWGEFSVFNFVIRRNPNTKQTKTTRIRIPMPIGEQIKDILLLEFNTLLLFESGRIYYFSSSSRMRKLNWIENVRTISKCLQGFSVIRLTSERKLVLEIYEDVINMGKNATGSLKCDYDITFDDQNLFKCDWRDEHYYLLSIAINESNLKFLQLVTRTTLNLEQEELHLFAISGNVFLLMPGADDASYNVETLFSYSSNVAIIKLDFERNFFIIFLQCGVIDIWYMSSKWQHLGHQTHSIGIEYTGFSYSQSRAAFYFTDENEVAEFRFYRITENEELALHEQYKSIPGILICTWIEAIRQLVCLDCNNIFHQLSFDTAPNENSATKPKEQHLTKTAEFEKFSTLYEVTPHRVAQLLEKGHMVQKLNELPKLLHSEIEQQYRKQEILAIAGKRRFYKTLFNARLEFSVGVSNYLQNDVIPLYTQNHLLLNQSSLLALIHIELKHNQVFHSSIWQLHLQFESSNHIFTLPRELLRNKLCLIVPLDMSAQKLLPKFHLHLYTFVSCARNYVAIALPISIVINYDTIAQFFTDGKSSLFKSLHSQYKLEDVLAHFDTQPKLLAGDIKYCFNVPKKFTLESILKTPQVDEIIFIEDSLELKFMGFKISVCLNETENIIVLRSNSATSIYYLKIYLQLVCEQQRSIGNTQNREDALQKVLRHQCTVERLYGALQNDDNEELFEDPQIKHMNLLRELYTKIREELSQILF